MTSTTTRAVTGATSRRAFIAGAAAIGAASAVQAAPAASGPTMRDLIVAHRKAERQFRKADAVYEATDLAILQSFRDDPFLLPCEGRTFSAVRSIGAEAVIKKRATPNQWGTFCSLGPCSPTEAANLRQFEDELRAREAEFGWPAICIAHEALDKAETAAWHALLKHKPVDLEAAAYRMRYLVIYRRDEVLDESEIMMLARSFLRDGK